jgi:hypothetical protein
MSNHCGIWLLWMRGVGFDCVYLLGFFVFGVAQRRPALFESGHYLMRAQRPNGSTA